MPEQKSVSPLLDGFLIGTPVNDHFGVCCYPAVKENAQRKYIVKAISIPASQAKLDALLITGAYKDPADAADYFHTLAEEVVREAEFLTEMSRLEGFLPFEGFQVEPMQKNRIGYEVYLLSGFRLSLERYMHRSAVTHLEAVNLGIDLCTALATCRRAGKLYIDLKPSNIYISNRKEFKIGDLGFVPLSSMLFSPMPEKYRSPYTAPELMDDLSVLNGTADTYAVGMILYQIFNNGLLPEDPAEYLPAPANADPDMAAILLKACAKNPQDRWEDPIQMGQAIRNYLQTGTVNNTTIMPPITGKAGSAPGVSGYETTKFPLVPPAPEADGTSDPPSSPEAEPPAEADPDGADSQSIQEPEPDQEPAESSEHPAEEPETPSQESAENSQETPPEPQEASPMDDWEQTTAAEIEAAAAAEFAALTGEPPAQEEAEPTLDDAHLDSELDALHQILKTGKNKPSPRKEQNITPVVIKPPKKKKSAVRVLFTIFLICLAIAGSVWGYLFYTTAYMVNVESLTAEGSLNRLTVTVQSDAQEGTLTAVCSDPYGNSSTQYVRDGKAEFQQLTPGTFYTVELKISGLHKLNGPVTTHYTTESATTVAALTAVVGSEDGSAVLNLIVEGHMPDQWRVLYSAEGEPELRQSFSGSSTIIDSLVIGKTYTFRLENSNGEAVDGNSTAQLKASRVISTRNVNIVSCVDGQLLVTWDSNLPEEAQSWVVHCFGQDYDQTQEVTQMQASFSGILSDRSYTVEVRAKGMGQGDRDTVSANPINLSNFQVDASAPQELLLSWDYSGSAPEDGWLVQYTLDNSDLPCVMKCQSNQVSIAPRVPGAIYHFSVQAGDASVLNRRQTFSCPAAEIYSGHGITGNNLSCSLLPTPEDSWSYSSVGNSLNTNLFQAGQSISLILSCNIGFYLTSEDLNILYVYRDDTGSVLTELLAEETVDWHTLWNRNDSRHTELTVPTAPGKPGSYTLDIYFDGMSAVSAAFMIA